MRRPWFVHARYLARGPAITYHHSGTVRRLQGSIFNAPILSVLVTQLALAYKRFKTSAYNLTAVRHHADPSALKRLPFAANNLNAHVV